MARCRVAMARATPGRGTGFQPSNEAGSHNALAALAPHSASVEKSAVSCRTGKGATPKARYPATVMAMLTPKDGSTRRMVGQGRHSVCSNAGASQCMGRSTITPTRLLPTTSVRTCT